MFVQVGYARVSSGVQSLELQTDALNKVGCERIFEEVASGAKSARPELEQALSFVRKGDVLVVWMLDRLGRSVKHLIELVSDLRDRGAGFRSIQENIDTTTASGKLFFHIMGALAEFERELIRERTRAGLEAARARGRLGGRPAVMTPKKVRAAESMLRDPHNSVGDVCRALGISKPTLYRHVNVVGIKPEGGRITKRDLG